MSPPPRMKPRSYRAAALGFAMMVAAPTALAGAYYHLVAADRYVAEIRYSVRGGAISPDAGSGALQGGGGLIVAGDSFILADYIRSARAMLDVEAQAPLREMLARDGGDPIRRFDPRMPTEDLVDFWTAAVSPRFDAVTGITTVSVALFTPQDAEAVAQVLIDQLRRVVDSLSSKARTEMLRYVEDEFARATADLDAARAAIETFRRTNRIITPDEEVTIGSTIIGNLTRQIADNRVALRSLRERAPNSPRIPVFEGEIASLEAQLLAEIARRSEATDGAALPEQLTSFDELQNAFEIARDNYVSTLRLKQQAEAAAALGQAQLVVFVPPHAPDIAVRPRRWVETLKVFGVAFAVWLIGRIFLASLSTQ